MSIRFITVSDVHAQSHCHCLRSWFNDQYSAIFSATRAHKLHASVIPELFLASLSTCARQKVASTAQCTSAYARTSSRLTCVLVTRSKLHSAPVKCIFVRTREARVAADVVRALTTSPASADVSLHEKTDTEEYDVDIPARL